MDKDPQSPPSDPDIQAAKLIQEGSDKKPITSDQIGHAARVGAMPAGQKLEFYSHLVRTELTNERNRLLQEKGDLDRECRHLRVSDKELHALKKSVARDRWEFAVSAIAMTFGGALIGSFPDGTKEGFAGMKPPALFGCGWAMILVGCIWQVGKTAIVAAQDAITGSKSNNPDPPSQQ